MNHWRKDGIGGEGPAGAPPSRLPPGDANRVLAEAMQSWRSRGRQALSRGRPDEAVPALVRARELAEQAGQLRKAIQLSLDISAAYTQLDDAATALQWARQATDLARPAGRPACLGRCLAAVATLLKVLQRPAEARLAASEAHHVLQPLVGMHTRAAVDLMLADLDLEAGALDRASAGYRSLLAQQPQPGPGVTVAAWCGLGQALTLRGEGAPALAALQHAQALAQQAGLADLQIRALQLMAEWHTRWPAPLSPAAAAHSARVHLLSQAVALAAAVPGALVAPGLLDPLAQAHAQAGDLALAYQTAQQAANARRAMQARKAATREMALSLRREMEATRVERERLREDALHAAQRAGQLRANQAMLEQLGRIGQAITGQLDIDTVFSRIQAHLTDLVAVDHLSIWLLQPDGQTLGLRFGVEAGQRMAPAQVRLDASFSKVAQCLRNNHELLHESPADRPEPGHMPGTLRTHSALFGPLQVRGHTVGVLSIQSTQAQAYGQREQLVFRTVCAYGAIALDHAAAYEQLQQARQAMQRAGDGERQARLRAQQATRMKNDFLARVSQDLRLPLAQLHVSLQDVQASAQAGHDSLTTALKRSHEVNVLARDLLELARLESGAVNPEPEVFSLTELIHDVLHKLADGLSRRGQSVQLQPLETGCDVRGDIGMIERVLTELLGHASARSPAGGGIGLGVLVQATQVHVQVLDSGPSWADAAASGLPSGPDRAGTGLGLLIAGELLRLHGQALSFQAVDGHGQQAGFNLMLAER